MAKDNKGLSSKDIQELLSDNKYRIELHSLVHDETETVYKILNAWSTQTTEPIPNIARARIEQAEKVSKRLREIFAYGNYFGTKEQSSLWALALARLGQFPHSSGSVFLLKLQAYPSLLVLYSGGLAALASNNLSNLGIILNTEAKSSGLESRKLVLEANCTMLGESGNSILELERRKTPLSDHLYDLFNETMPSEIKFGYDFEVLFDRWEILLAMHVADLLRDRAFGPWAPVGAFSWRNGYDNNRTLDIVGSEIEQEGKDWPLLQAGLFGGSEERAKSAFNTVKQIAGKVAFF